MKFVKDNLVLVICGGVVLLLVGAYFLSGMFQDAPLQDELKERAAQLAAIDTIKRYAVNIPADHWEKDGAAAATAPKLVGPPDAGVVDLHKAEVSSMEGIRRQLIAMGSEANRKRYVQVDLRTGKVLAAQLDNQPIVGLLPKIGPGGQPLAFKDLYQGLFTKWTNLMVGGTAATPKAPGTVPDKTALDAAYTAKQVGAGGPGGGPGPGGGMMGPVGMDQRQQNEFERSALTDRASSIRMYVDAAALQPAGWADSSNPPTEEQIFTGLVECWFKGDVVAAIQAVNDPALAGIPPDQRNVGRAPIKRLESIVVGNDALTSHIAVAPGQSGTGVGAGAASSAGTLFFNPTSTGAPGASGATAGTPAQNSIDFTRPVMTGRASGDSYDVVLMSVVVDLDPAYLNQFLDSLYKRNIGFTVVNEKVRAVDPLEAASNGFLYGPTQVVQVELVVEGLLFRDWTKPLMPDSIRAQLGIPADQPAQAN